MKPSIPPGSSRYPQGAGSNSPSSLSPIDATPPQEIGPLLRNPGSTASAAGGNPAPRTSFLRRTPSDSSLNSVKSDSEHGAASSAAHAEPVPRPDSPLPQVTVLAFAGDTSVGEREKFGFPPAPVRRRTGHMMFSINGGETVYGFSLVAPEGRTPADLMQDLSVKKTFPGIVRDDTASLPELIEQPLMLGSTSHEDHAVYKLDIPVSKDKYAEIKAKMAEIPLDQPLENIRYGLPSAMGPGKPVENCVTFPMRRLGFPVPFQSGRISDVMKTLKEHGSEFHPDEE